MALEISSSPPRPGLGELWHLTLDPTSGSSFQVFLGISAVSARPVPSDGDLPCGSTPKKVQLGSVIRGDSRWCG